MSPREILSVGGGRLTVRRYLDADATTEMVALHDHRTNQVLRFPWDMWVNLVMRGADHLITEDIGAYNAAVVARERFGR